MNLAFLRGLVENLNSVDVKDGQLLFTTNQGHIYLDTADGRVELYKKDLDAIKAEIAALVGGEDGNSIADMIATAIDALDVTDAPVAGKYVTAVSETNGKITVTRADLPDYSDTYAPKDQTEAKLSDLDDSVTALQETVDNNSDAIDVLNGEGEGSVKKMVDSAINKFATDVTDDGIVNSYKELIDYAATNGSEMVTMAGKVSTLETNVADNAADIADNATAIEVEKTRATAAEAKALADAKEYADEAVASATAVLTWGDFGTIESGEEE